MQSVASIGLIIGELRRGSGSSYGQRPLVYRERPRLGLLLDRYMAGEYETVWAEMLAGVDWEGNPISVAEQWTVAEETMRRARQNIETIIAELNAIGYQFGVYPDGTLPYGGEPFEGPLVDPAPDVEEQIVLIERLVGTVPISVKAFWKIVGGVNLVGAFPAGEDANFDPLWVAPGTLEYVQEVMTKYEDDESEPFFVALAPDHFHKDNTSGGPPYGIFVPNPAADAPWEDEWHETTFVNYLRICFQWGGFPMPYKTGKPEHPQILSLSKGLLPI